MNEPSPIILSSPDAGSRSAGGILRAAREAQGISLERLAFTIKVTPAKLEDLEQGRYDRLPDPNFTRALAMTICRVLKIDASEVLAALPAAKTIPLASGKPPLNQPFKESKGGSPLFDKQFDASALLSVKWLAPAVLLLGALVIYALPDSVDVPAWVRRNLQTTDRPAQVVPSTPAVVPKAPSAPVDEASAPIEAAPPPVDVASSADAIPPGAEVPSAPAKPVKSGAQPLVLDAVDASGAARAAAPTAPLAATAYVDPRLTKSSVPAFAPASLPVPAAATASPAPVAVGEVGSMVLEAQQGSWVEVKDAKGNKLLSRHVQAGERVPLEGAVPLKLVIGNAPGMRLSFKGQGVDLARYTQSNVARLELK